MYPLIASVDHDGAPVSFGVYGERASESSFGNLAAMSLFELPTTSIVQYGILLNKTI